MARLPSWEPSSSFAARRASSANAKLTNPQPCTVTVSAHVAKEQASLEHVYKNK